MFNVILKSLREEKNILQSQLANELNISQSQYSKYENGIHEPDINTLIILANYFNVSTDYLLGISKVKTENELLQELDQELKLIKNKFIDIMRLK